VVAAARADTDDFSYACQLQHVRLIAVTVARIADGLSLGTQVSSDIF
jgi:hypothetical protein